MNFRVKHRTHFLQAGFINPAQALQRSAGSRSSTQPTNYSESGEREMPTLRGYAAAVTARSISSS